MYCLTTCVLIFSVASWFSPRRVFFDRWSFACFSLWNKCLTPVLFNLFIDQFAMPFNVWLNMSPVLWMTLLFDSCPNIAVLNCFAMPWMPCHFECMPLKYICYWIDLLFQFFLAHFSCIFAVFHVFFFLQNFALFCAFWLQFNMSIHVASRHEMAMPNII